MDELMGIVRGIITAVLMLLFCAVAVRAWSARNRQTFDAAARLPLEEDAGVGTPSTRETQP